MKRAVVFLKKGEGRTVRSGGAWIYDNEIALVEGDIEPGDLVDVFGSSDNPQRSSYFLGTGFYNATSKITIRLLSRERVQEADGSIHGVEIDRAFLKKRVEAAWQYRKETMGAEDTLGSQAEDGMTLIPGSCRVIFGEADFLPGLVVDKFSDVLVVQSLALGIDRLKETILDCLKEVLAADGILIRGVYERSDAKVREQEGMTRLKGFLGAEFDTNIEIIENGIRYQVDVQDGQKTGFFLDQKYNRKAIWKVCAGGRVLDGFTHTGSFALNAAMAGAREVLAVDASELAVEQGRKNALLNGLSDRVSFQCADVFELLPELERRGEKFDVVILDPPAFTKSRASVKKAIRGYKEINLRGLRLVKDGGYLATCSCSHFLTPELFADTIAKAAKDAHKRLRQVEFRTQAPDHPILWSAEESYYLKFYLFQVLG